MDTGMMVGREIEAVVEVAAVAGGVHGIGTEVVPEIWILPRWQRPKMHHPERYPREMSQGRWYRAMVRRGRSRMRRR